MKTMDLNAFRYQEIAFSVVMSFITVLNHENPLLVYPDILWAFAALLGANLAYQLALKRLKVPLAAAMTSTAANIVLVSAIVHASGDCQSSFWPMYLLPIFTACLYLERRHVIWAVSACAAFLAYFYIDAFWKSMPWEPSEFAIKAGVLALAAAVTMPLAFREREQRRALQASRDKIEDLALSLGRRNETDMAIMRKENLRELAPRIAHDINNPLAVILGSVELMMEDAAEDSPLRQDLERIQTAARRCAKVTDSLFEYDDSGRETRTALREASGSSLLGALR